MHCTCGYARLCVIVHAYACVNRPAVTDIMVVTDVEAFKLLTLRQCRLAVTAEMSITAIMSVAADMSVTAIM